MRKSYQLSNGSLIPVEEEAEAARALVQVFIAPDTAERNLFRDTFDIDDHTIASALDPEEVSRMEVEPEYVALIWKRPTNYSGKDSLSFDVSSLGLFLFPNQLLLVASDDIAITGLGTRAHPLRTMHDVVVALLLHTVHHYLGHLKAIKMVAHEIQEKINTSLENRHLIQMFNLSESLIYYVNAIDSNAAVLDRLRIYLQRQQAPEELQEFLEDLIIENHQCHRQAEIYSSVLSGLMDARGSIVNNNMNHLLKNLTIINIVFLPLNLIAGIGGMSEFTVMSEAVHLHPALAYAIFCVAMLGLGWLTARVLQSFQVGIKEDRSLTRRLRS